MPVKLPNKYGLLRPIGPRERTQDAPEIVAVNNFVAAHWFA